MFQNSKNRPGGFRKVANLSTIEVGKKIHCMFGTNPWYAKDVQKNGIVCSNGELKRFLMVGKSAKIIEVVERRRHDSGNYTTRWKITSGFQTYLNWGQNGTL